MSPAEYAKKYPHITMVAKAIGVFGRPVRMVVINVSSHVGFAGGPYGEGDAMRCLDELEAYLVSIRVEPL